MSFKILPYSLRASVANDIDALSSSDWHLSPHSVSSLSYPIELPDIIGIINDKLGRAVEEIANRAIGETYVPLVQRMLTRVDKQVYFSDILKEFVELTDAKDIDDCELDMNLDAGYGWYRVSIAHKDAQYEFTLHNHVKAGKEKGKLFQLLGIPTCTGWPDKYSQPKMKFKVEGSAEIEMPWTQDILRDKFTSYMASIALSDAEIIVDKTYFEDEMFPTHCHCD